MADVFEEAERRYLGPRMYVGTITDREIAAFVAGANFVEPERIRVAKREAWNECAREYVDALGYEAYQMAVFDNPYNELGGDNDR